MISLAEVIDVVVGVDTHKYTHTAAVVSAGTGGEQEVLTAAADPDGYAALVELADGHSGLRVWAAELRAPAATAPGLLVTVRELGEWVIELDRPDRPARRHGAKSDPLQRRARRPRGAIAHEAGPAASRWGTSGAVRAGRGSTLGGRGLHGRPASAPRAGHGRTGVPTRKVP